MKKEMEYGKDIIIMINSNLKVNIEREKDVENEKNIIFKGI